MPLTAVKQAEPDVRNRIELVFNWPALMVSDAAAHER
jgi:hypothetical protein